MNVVLWTKLSWIMKINLCICVVVPYIEIVREEEVVDSVCGSFAVSCFSLSLFLFRSLWMWIWPPLFVCLYVCEWERKCITVYVQESERGRGREKEGRGREGEREREGGKEGGRERAGGREGGQERERERERRVYAFVQRNTFVCMCMCLSAGLHVTCICIHTFGEVGMPNILCPIRRSYALLP